MTVFAGRREGRHPVLYVVTKNNMLSDRGPATPRVALAPAAFSLDGVSRDQLMDAMYRDERIVADRTVDSHIKKRRRKNSRRKKGHRQDLTTVRITNISGA